MIKPSLILEVYRQAELAAPVECCGFLDRISVFPCRNAWGRTGALAEGPAGYQLSAADAIRLYDHIDRVGPEQVVIYHSHPAAAPNWSQTDQRDAFWNGRVILPSVRRLIVSVEDGCRRGATLYRFEGGTFNKICHFNHLGLPLSESQACGSSVEYH